MRAMLEAWFFRTLLQLGTGLSGSMRKKRMNVTCGGFGGEVRAVLGSAARRSV